jgi:pimeloyl-ACP methyl ester carboxylesterase
MHNVNFLAAASVAVLLSAAMSAPASAGSCEALKNIRLSNTVITESVRVGAGSFKDPTVPWPKEDLPERCQVKGIIRPTPDSKIAFEVWMPMSGWNGKLQGAGNGGFGGAINYQSGLVEALQRGYAAVSTDTGHVGNSDDARWAIGHPEKVIDFGYRAIHLMTVNAKAITKAFYGKNPHHAYFSSCSNGGRQALMLAQRYPEDYDGIVAGAPANDFTGLMLDFIWNERSMMRPGAFIPADRAPAIQAAVNEQCGARDGIVGLPQECKFDPSKLLCSKGESAGCLTGPQIQSLRDIYQGMHSRDGRVSFPGFTPGAEVGGWDKWIFGERIGDSNQARFGWNFMSAMVKADPHWQVDGFDFDREGRAAIDKLAPLLNATDPDMGRFAARGGKLIMFHGWADPAVPPLHTVRYFESIGVKMGAAQRKQFVRLFMVPGMQHCLGGPGPSSFGGIAAAKQPPDPETDVSAAVERWVEQGIAPETVIAVKPKDALAGAFGSPKGGVERTSLLCAYPKQARWRGSGSAADAKNFECVE